LTLATVKTLLLEDDPLMRRFVSLALDETACELTFCQDVPQALAALAEQRFDFILTDLMLPGESGLSFIRRLAADKALAQGAQIVALSAGIDAAMTSELTSLGVQQQLLKPVSVKALQAVFKTRPETLAEQQLHTQQAVERYFGGQQELFRQFKAQSLSLFVEDVKKGDALLEASDFQALHQLAHSLKSALLLLGETHAHKLALALEHDLANHPEPVKISPQWCALRTLLLERSRNES
jgi:DNA-binding response OmpR family regulator